MKFVIFYTCIDLVYNPSKVSFSNFVLLSSNQLCTYKWCPLHLGNWVSGTQTCLRSSTLSLKIFKSLIQVLNGDFHAKKKYFFQQNISVTFQFVGLNRFLQCKDHTILIMTKGNGSKLVRKKINLYKSSKLRLLNCNFRIIYKCTMYSFDFDLFHSIRFN